MREWLREARQAKGLTAKEVAECIGLSESGYCYVEQGKRHSKMSIDMAVKLSQVLQIELTDIIENETKS